MMKLCPLIVAAQMGVSMNIAGFPAYANDPADSAYDNAQCIGAACEWFVLNDENNVPPIGRCAIYRIAVPE